MTSKRSATSDPRDTLALLHGLIIRQPWLDRILDGQKTWEIRGTNTQIRGPIGLIQQSIAYTHPWGAVRWVRFRPPLAVTLNS